MLPPSMERGFGPYEVVRKLGAGAAGIVYEVHDASRSIRAALKTLPQLDAAAAARLKTEFRTASGVHHKNLVRLYELAEWDGRWGFTMELLSGRPLGRVRPADARAVFAQLALGVAELHRHGVLHLDLKPANVMLEPDGRVVLLDFGVSQLATGKTSAGALGGTPRYMAPERLARASSTRASDWYGFGLTLFEALTGALPFDDPWDTVEPGWKAPRLRSRVADVPEELDALCAALLEPDVASRAGESQVFDCFGLQSSGPAPSSGLVGREAALAELDAALTRVSAGATLLVRLVGGSGIGKSAVLDAFCERTAEARTAIVLRGRCFEWESGGFKGLDSAIEALRAHFGRDVLGGEALDAAAQLFPSVSWSAGSTPRTPGTDERARAFIAVKRMLVRASERQPLLLAIDDAQWGDLDGARLLHELLSQPGVPRLMVVLAYRPAEGTALDQVLEAGTAGFVTATVDLPPLAREDVQRLARALSPDAAAELIDRVTGEAGGNPFLIGQLARHGHAGRLEDIVRARVGALAPEARRVLEVVAVAGRLDGQDLALTAADSNADPHRVLHELRAGLFVRTGGPRGSDPIELHHDRLRDGILRGLDAGYRRELHRSIAEVLERRGNADPHQLSVHHEGAGSLEVAARHAAVAARRAFDSLAFQQAAKQLERALGLAPDAHPERRLWLELRARALFNAGRGAEAGPVFVAAAGLTDASEGRELRRLAGEAWLTSGQIEAGLEVLVPLAAEVGLNFHRAEWRAMLSGLSELVRLRFSNVERPALGAPSTPEQMFELDLCWTIGRGLGAIQPALGVDFMFRALNRALRVGEPRRLVRALATQGAALVALGGPLRSLGEACLRRAERIATETGDPQLQGTLLVFRGFSEIAGAGRWPIARALADEGVRMLRERCVGVAWEVDMGLGVRLKAFEPTGEIRALGEEAAQWSREAADRGDLYTQMVAAGLVAQHDLARDDVASARQRFPRLLAGWKREPYTVQHYHATRLDVMADLYEGRPHDGVRKLEADWPAMKKIQIHRLSLSRIELAALQANVLLSAGHDLNVVRRISKRLAAEARSDGPPHAAMLRGWLASFEGRAEEARVLLDQARVGYAANDMGQWACATERLLAELRGDDAAVARADNWFRSRGVVRPEAWARVFVPPLRAASIADGSRGTPSLPAGPATTRP